MERVLLRDNDGKIDIRASIFKVGSGVGECCAMLTSTEPGRCISDELAALDLASRKLPDMIGMKLRPVFMRYFLSDAVNQGDFVKVKDDCAVSVIGQSPLDGSRASLWVYMIENAVPEPIGYGFYKVDVFGHNHYWQGGAHISGANSEEATVELLDRYSAVMERVGCSLERDCQRTWFFVRDVDVNYAGMVRGRNEVFKRSGLTPQTHFIASTGICGSNPDHTSLVTMDTFTVKGLSRESVKYLYAPTHLNPTYEYGVAFERGTAIDYADRRHVLISGTASINNRGLVEHPGDVVRQTERMWENVGALLDEAGCGFDNVMHLIVYIRDIADYQTVRQLFVRRFPDMPLVIVLAPVCRPEWLIEMECMAIKPLDVEK